MRSFQPDLGDLRAAIEARVRIYGSVMAAERAGGLAKERYRGVLSGKVKVPGADIFVAAGLEPPSWAKLRRGQVMPKIRPVRPKPANGTDWRAVIRNHLRRERRLREWAREIAAALEREPDLGAGLAATAVLRRLGGRSPKQGVMIDQVSVRRFWDERRVS